MAIELTVRQAGDVTILDVAGRMVSGTEGKKLRDALDGAFEQGHRWLLVNCADLAFVDSSGLGDLVSAHAAIMRRGGVVRLLHAGHGLAELLARTRLDALLDVYDDEEAAVASFTSENNQRTQQKLASYPHREP